jgi:hypothetical protein
MDRIMDRILERIMERSMARMDKVISRMEEWAIARKQLVSKSKKTKVC